MTDMRGAQALAILEALEGLPPGSRVECYRVRARGAAGRWAVTVRVGPSSASRSCSSDESLTDALGQITTVLTLERGE